MKPPGPNNFNPHLIKVSKLQQKNPAIKELKAGSYRFVENGANSTSSDSIVEDFQINPQISVLFLSLDYHIKKPLYIKQRFEDLYRARRYARIILLLLHDHEDELNYLTDLQLECMKYDAQLIMCWSFSEAGLYIRTLKAYENKN